MEVISVWCSVLQQLDTFESESFLIAGSLLQQLDVFEFASFVTSGLPLQQVLFSSLLIVLNPLWNVQGQSLLTGARDGQRRNKKRVFLPSGILPIPYFEAGADGGMQWPLFRQ